MKKNIYDNQLQKTITEISRKMNPKPSKWIHLGYRKGKRVYMTESNLRKCDIDDICSDPLLQPVRNRRPPGPRPNRKPPPSNSLWHELLSWLGKSLLEMMSGQKK
ncbi:hypothetical protein ES703_85426 [subsurface metagenome]